MEESELRRFVGGEWISRVVNEEKLAIQLVAKNPNHLVAAVNKMQTAPNDAAKRKVFEDLSRDDKLAFVFLALDPKALEKVRDYLHRHR